MTFVQTSAAESSEPEALEDSAAHRVFSAWRELRRGAAMRSLKEGLYGAGDDALDPAQLDALELVVEADELRMSELASALYVDASTATRTIDRLIHQSLVKRRAAPDDGRGIVVRPTARGRRQVERIREGREILMNRILEGFGHEDRELLATMVEQLAQSVNRVAQELSS